MKQLEVKTNSTNLKHSSNFRRVGNESVIYVQAAPGLYTMRSVGNTKLRFNKIYWLSSLCIWLVYVLTNTNTLCTNVVRALWFRYILFDLPRKIHLRERLRELEIFYHIASGQASIGRPWANPTHWINGKTKCCWC